MILYGAYEERERCVMTRVQPPLVSKPPIPSWSMTTVLIDRQGMGFSRIGLIGGMKNGSFSHPFCCCFFSVCMLLANVVFTLWMHGTYTYATVIIEISDIPVSCL